VIASGRLAEVPFGALRLKDRYLIEHRPVALLPGLTALRCDSSIWDDRVVIVGDSRGDLPEAAHEATQLARSYGGVAHIGPAATREALALAHRARLLHLAVHAVATSSGRAIALADGTLTAADVLAKDLDPELVVLSGCATAASSDAESWSGFPSAFLAAGSRYVIATLRSLEDGAAARVTSAYYDQPASLNPIERLAAAQRVLARTLPASAWASFTAWGSAACPAPAPLPPRKAEASPPSTSRECGSDPIDPWPPPPARGRSEFLFDPG
jgi:CHAT domain-containing protein